MCYYKYMRYSRLAKHRPEFDMRYYSDIIRNPVPLPIPSNDIIPLKMSLTREEKNLVRYQKIKQIMDNNISNPDFSLHKASEEVSISDRQIQRIFVSQGSPGFRHELTDMRLSRACYLLKNTTESIEDISKKVGYKQSIHFSKAFRRQFNVSPRGWRKEHQVQSNTQSVSY